MADVFELERAAGHQRLRPAATVPHRAGRTYLALDQSIDPDGFGFWVVGEDVSIPVRQYHQITACQGCRLHGALHSKPRLSAFNDVEMGVSARRQADGPGRRHVAT